MRFLRIALGRGMQRRRFGFGMMYVLSAHMLSGYVDDADCLSSADEETWRKT
jgi:hypothetical protein